SCLIENDSARHRIHPRLRLFQYRLADRGLPLGQRRGWDQGVWTRLGGSNGQTRKIRSPLPRTRGREVGVRGRAARWRHFQIRPLTPALSPEYRGEGVRQRLTFGNAVLRSRMRLLRGMITNPTAYLTRD